jgi:hydrogenase maturation protease
VSAVRVLCLGNPHASDDGAAFAVADALTEREAIRAGRPGSGLLDLLEGDAPVVLVDATRTGAPAGTVHRLDLAELAGVSQTQPNVSSHGFGPAEALQLGHALGRPLPRGTFVGVEGERFEPGSELSPAVRQALPELVAAVRQAIATLE